MIRSTHSMVRLLRERLGVSPAWELGRTLALHNRVSEARCEDQSLVGHVLDLDRFRYGVGFHLDSADQGVFEVCCSCHQDDEAETPSTGLRVERGRAHFCAHAAALLYEAEALGILPPVDLTEATDPVVEFVPSHGFKERLDFDIKIRPVSPLSTEKGWRSGLAKVLRAQSDSQLEAAQGKVSQRTLWFQLAPGTRRRGGLSLNLYEQKRLKSGHWSRPKSVKMSDALVERFEKTEYESILDLLKQSWLAGMTSWGSWNRSFNRSLASETLVLSPHACREILRALARSGRLTWGSAGELVPSQRLRWDGEHPFEGELRIREDEESQWVVEPRLKRGEEALDLDDLLFLVEEIRVLVFARRIIELDDDAIIPWIQATLDQSSILIPGEDQEEFLATLARIPKLPVMDLPDGFPWRCQRLSPDPVLILSPFGPTNHGAKTPRESWNILGELSFLYGETKVKSRDKTSVVADEQTGRLLARDLERESFLESQLLDAGSSIDGEEHSIPSDHLPTLVRDLVAKGWKVMAEGKWLRVATDFQISVSSGIDWLDIKGSAEFQGQRVPLPSLLAAVRNDLGFIELGDGQMGMLPENWLARFRSLQGFGVVDGDTIKMRRSQALMLDFWLQEQGQATYDQEYLNLRERLQSATSSKSVKEPARFQGELRPYQRRGLGWLVFLREIGLGGCLADDMGLGKTVQVLALLQWVKNRTKVVDRLPSLVVAPKSLVHNWLAEVQRFCPKMKAMAYHDSGREALVSQFAQVDIVVTTYGVIHRDISRLKQKSFEYVILDESQAIKNEKAQISKAVRLLPGRHRLAMSGTPIENHLGELWSLFEFLNPGMLGRISSFQRWVGKRTPGFEEDISSLSLALSPFFLRRTKSEVLKELPEKVEQVLWCELTGAQRKAYEKVRRYYRCAIEEGLEAGSMGETKMKLIEALLRLRQIACHEGLIDPSRRKEPSAKLEALFSGLEEVFEKGHKVLVFSQFTSLLKIVEDRVQSQGWCYEYLDGQTRDRAKRVERFQDDPDCSLFLISLKAGGVGLNLTAADYVFILDPWWNPATEKQAVDRAHRIGQSQKVFSYRLIAKGTVEEKILRLQERKVYLAETLLKPEKSLVAELSTEDIRELLV